MAIQDKLSKLLADLQSRPAQEPSVAGFQEAMPQDPAALLEETRQLTSRIGQKKAAQAAQMAQAPQQVSVEAPVADSSIEASPYEAPSLEDIQAEQQAVQDPIAEVKAMASQIGQAKGQAVQAEPASSQMLPSPDQLVAANQPPGLPGYAADMNDTALAKALDEQREMQRQALIARAFSGIGAGGVIAAGGKPADDSAMFDAMDTYAKGVTDKVTARRKGISEEESLKQNRAKTFADADATAKADPNSDISKSVREWAKKRGFKVSDNVSINQMQSILPLYLKDIESRERIEDRKLAASEKAEAKAKSKTEGLTKGQEALDRDFAKEYNDWTSGGQAALDKNVQRLEDAKAVLKKRSKDTFGTSGRVVGNLPDFMRSEESKRIRQDVHAAAQGALRATLGPQFTENEGIRIMNMSYDETLSPQENIRKIDAAVKELKAQKANKAAKVKQFEQKGTLAGFKAGASKSDSLDVEKEVSQSKPKTVTQNGHTYTLNEATGEYE